MSGQKIGPREAERRAQREARFARTSALFSQEERRRAAVAALSKPVGDSPKKAKRKAKGNRD